MHRADARVDGRVTAVAALVALACLGFAAVNVAFEATGRFDDGEYGDYSLGLSIMDWLVTGLKVLGAGVAVLSVTEGQRLLSRSRLGVLLWGAFATVAVYSLGSVTQAAAILAGVTGERSDITVASVVYVVGFLLAGIGFGVLAVSYHRRHRLPRRLPVLGLLGAPVLIGLLLVGIPALLVLADVMPSA